MLFADLEEVRQTGNVIATIVGLLVGAYATWYYSKKPADPPKE